MATTMPFVDLENGWYNGFRQSMGQDEHSFQIIQPASPLLAGSNAFLWMYLNNIPPVSLTQNYVASSGNQFYSDYRGLMSALVPTRNVDVEKDVGAANYARWIAYVTRLVPPPSINQLPTLFRLWAMINAPSVAQKGASDYAAILLDPVASAQTALTLTYTDEFGQAKPPNWTLGYNELVSLLTNSPGRSFTFTSSTMNSDVSNSWTGGRHSGFFGLWGGSNSTSTVSTKFASSTVTVTATFERVFPFVTPIGDWYSSAAMGLAFANRSGNPWSPDSSINWNNTFGSSGNMQRFMVNLLVASGMHVTVTSTASYSESEQTEVRNSSHAGFWPFYVSGGGGGDSNTVEFSETNTLTITTNSLPGVPVVLGGNVLPVSEFVGHSLAMAMHLAQHPLLAA